MIIRPRDRAEAWYDTDVPETLQSFPEGERRVKEVVGGESGEGIHQAVKIPLFQSGTVRTQEGRRDVYVHRLPSSKRHYGQG